MRATTKIPPPENSYKLISKNLRQCQRCFNFIRGSISHFANHLKTHNKCRLKYQCPACLLLYSRRDYLIKHGKKIHSMDIDKFHKVPVPAPPIKPVATWIPPFESTPRHTTISALTTTKSTSALLQQMINLPRPISPIPTKPFNSHHNHPPALRQTAWTKKLYSKTPISSSIPFMEFFSLALLYTFDT